MKLSHAVLAGTVLLSISSAASATPDEKHARALGQEFAAPGSVCDQIRDNNRRIIAAAIDTCSRDTYLCESRNNAVTRALHSPFFNYCDDRAGGWVVEVKSAVNPELSTEAITGCSAVVSYTISLVPHAGAPPSPRRQDEWVCGTDGGEFLVPEVVNTFDFDGDGLEDIVLKEGRDGTIKRSWLTILHRVGNSLEPLDVGFQFDSMVDADHDGRPDIVYATFFDAELPTGIGGTHFYGVPLLAHSLPHGKFTMSDDVARTWARAQCPTRPRHGSFLRPVADGTLPVDMRKASCARLWGEPISDIVQAAMKLAALPRGKDAEVRYDECHGDCVSTTLSAFFSRPLPFETLDVSGSWPQPCKSLR